MPEYFFMTYQCVPIYKNNDPPHLLINIFYVGIFITFTVVGIITIANNYNNLDI